MIKKLTRLLEALATLIIALAFYRFLNIRKKVFLRMARHFLFLINFNY